VEVSGQLPTLPFPLERQTGFEPIPCYGSSSIRLCKQTQQRPPHFRSCRFLFNISTGARKLMRAVCTFPLWRKVRACGLKKSVCDNCEFFAGVI